MKDLVHAINPIIAIRDFLGSTLNPPEEIGHSIEDRARQKAYYYSAHCAYMPVLAEDTGVYFDQKIDLPAGIDITHADSAIEPGKRFEFWRSVFGKYEVKSGYIRKGYALLIEGSSIVGLVEIPFRMSISAESAVASSKNILNNFLVPEGFVTPIARLSLEEKSKMYAKYFIPQLSKIVSNLKGFKE